MHNQVIKIALGADHRGFALKTYLSHYTTINNYTVIWHDVGAYNQERSDYPVFSIAVAQLLQEQVVDAGIMACGTGIGMAVAANRFAGVYAGVVWNEAVARLAKQDDNINILVLPADYITHEQGLAFVQIWLDAEFKGGRYAQRIALIDAITPENRCCL